MARPIKEIALTAERPLKPGDSQVENMSRVVCALLVRGLQKSGVSPNFWKISIRFNYADHSEDQKIVGGILVANRNFPVLEFLGWKLEKRQNYMLQFVSGTLRDIFTNQALDTRAIDAAVNHVIDAKFLNVIKGAKRFSNSFGAEVAHIECEQLMDEASIYVTLKIRRKIQRKFFIAKTLPEEFIFQNFFGTIEWINSSNFILRQINGKILTPTPCEL